jgi:lambda family phage portal protein
LNITFTDLTKLPTSVVTTVSGGAGGALAIGGAMEGADNLNRETALWNASIRPPDPIINTVKETADARGRDSVRNDGYISGASSIHKNSIIGSQYRLNARPNWKAIAQATGNKGFDMAWATEFQTQVEARFGLLADSTECWLDAERTNTFTGMLRLAIGVFLATGEVIATAEWVRDKMRPYKTAIQMVRSDRLCNPYGLMDTRTRRRGIEKDEQGRPLSYWFRKGEKFDPYPDDYAWMWVNVPAMKPWGRKQVIHIIEQGDVGQSRGVADIVSVLKNIRMTKKFREVVLQSAVVNATYAAAIESELPNEAVAVALGQGNGPGGGIMGLYAQYMGALTQYLGGANNIAVDGAQVPHLFPGTKMKLQNAGTPGGIGTNFEESLLRHTAAALDISYESLSRDFSKTNYSSGRLAMSVQQQAMSARKKHVADRLADNIYQLWLEEAFNAGEITLPKGANKNVFYMPLMKEAFCRCSWIGSGAGQIDELKETQAALLRIAGGISTHEIEGARLGLDWREIVEQRQMEQEAFRAAGVIVSYDTIKPNGTQPTDVVSGQGSGQSGTGSDSTTPDPAEEGSGGGNQ